MNICESLNMADHQDSATPPAIEISTQPRVDHLLSGKDILAGLASIRDSLKHSAGFKKGRETSGAGKNNI